MARQETGQILGPVTDGDAVDNHALLSQHTQNGRFGGAWYAPTGEHVDQTGLAAKIGAGHSWPTLRRRGQREAWHRFTYQLRRMRPIVGAIEADRDDTKEYDERGKRYPEPNTHQLYALRIARPNSLRARPSSDSAPPMAIKAPPSQINVTIGFHHSRNCQRPWLSGLPSTR